MILEACDGATVIVQAYFWGGHINLVRCATSISSSAMFAYRVLCIGQDIVRMQVRVRIEYVSGINEVVLAFYIAQPHATQLTLASNMSFAR